jgi:peptide/nickel transport system substrate-binding protein
MRTLNRRHRGRRVALAVAVLTAAALAAACTSSTKSASAGSSSAAGSSSGSSAAADTGPATGVINWAYTSDQPNWDPIVVGATSATQLLSTIYEPLFTLKPDGTLGPALAESYKYNDTGDALTVTLKPGLTFQDGSPVDANAVAFNVKRIQTQTNSALRALWQDVASTTVIDATHITLNLKGVDYQIPYVLANRSSLLASPVAAADANKLNTQLPVGAGPFKLEKYTPGAEMTLTKWDGYWDAKDIHVKTVNIFLTVDPATLLSGLQTGQYNFSPNLPAQDIVQAKAAGLSVSTDPAHGWTVQFLNLNVNQAPFNNPAVFKAVQYAINRPQLVSQLTFGQGTPAYQPWPSVSPLYNSALNSSLYPYDPAKAKQALKDAGVAPGSVTVELDFQGTFSTAGELIQQQLQAVGINTKLVSQQVNAFYAGYYANAQGKKTDSFALYGWVGRDSKLATLDDQFSSTGIINLSAPTTSPGYAAVRAKVLQTPLDSPDYKSVLQAASLEAVKGGSSIYLYSTPSIYATGKGWSEFPKIDGSFRWVGLTVGK